MIGCSDMILRWTFGETKERPTSLQAFDMLECSICYASKLFPNTKKYIIFNSINSSRTLHRLTEIARSKAELIEANSNWDNNTKNSFWKYIPQRIEKSKYEIVIDSDLILWDVPVTLKNWSQSDGLLINSDWNGRNYGDFDKLIDMEVPLNAGIIGYPPYFEFQLPDVMNFTDRFVTEQGFIANLFTSSNQKLFVLNKHEIFQSNAQNHVDKKVSNLIQSFSGAHFCGCNYCHYQHWDKFYKDDLWEYLHKTNSR